MALQSLDLSVDLGLDLAAFMLAVGMLALYGLTFSGHFPVEFRKDALRTRTGALVLWGTLLVAAVAAILTLVLALRTLPWPAIIIGGGGMLLAAPLLLRPFPDRFVNGLAGLSTFAVSALAIAVVLWAAGQ